MNAWCLDVAVCRKRDWVSFGVKTIDSFVVFRIPNINISPSLCGLGDKHWKWHCNKTFLILMSSPVLPKAPWCVLVLQEASHAPVHKVRAMCASGKQMAAACSLEAHVSLNNVRQWLLVSVKIWCVYFIKGLQYSPRPVLESPLITSPSEYGHQHSTWLFDMTAVRTIYFNPWFVK